MAMLMLFLALFWTSATVVPIPIVHANLEKVNVERHVFSVMPINGSDARGDCSSYEYLQSKSLLCSSDSSLTNGYSPSFSNLLKMTLSDCYSGWARDFVTIHRSQISTLFGYLYLAFNLASNTALDQVRISYFSCPDMGIGPPRGSIHRITRSDFLNPQQYSEPGISFSPPNDNRDCSIYRIDIKMKTLPIMYEFIAITLQPSDISEWVFLGEIEFLADKGAGTSFIPVAHTLPSELQSVNGSSLNGGCNNALTAANNRFCLFSGQTHTSNLVDGVVPSVDNSNGGWADGFFTLNRNGASSVMVGFEFDDPVNITQVELVLFDCPAFAVGATDSSIYTQTPDNNGLFNFNINHAVFEGSHQIEQSSCDSIVTINIPLSDYTYLSQYLFVVFSFDGSNPNDWVFIAEIRFIDESLPTPTSAGSTIGTPISTITKPFTSTVYIPHPPTIAATQSTTNEISTTSTPVIKSIPFEIKNCLHAITITAGTAFLVTLILTSILSISATCICMRSKYRLSHKSRLPEELIVRATNMVAISGHSDSFESEHVDEHIYDSVAGTMAVQNGHTPVALDSISTDGNVAYTSGGNHQYENLHSAEPHN